MSTAPMRSDYRLTFLVLTVAVVSFALLQSLLVPVLPELQHSLHTSQSAITWLITAYLISGSVATPILGRIGDMYGKKRVLICVLVTLTVGAALAGIATSISVMIAARAIQGVGSAAIPLAFGIIRDEFPREKVRTAVSTISGLAAAGSGAGLVLTGPIVNALNYHWLFWIPAIIVGLATVAAFLLVPESPNRTPVRINWLAALLLSAWLVSLLLGISKGSSWGWTSGSVDGLLLGSVVLAVAWIAVESRSDQPLIDMRMMRMPAVLTTNLVAAFLGFGLYSALTFLPQFLQAPSATGYGFGAGVTESGLLLLPMSGLMFLFGALSGPLAGRFGAKAVIVSGMGLTSPAFLILAFAHSSVVEVLIGAALAGAGFGLVISAMASVIVDAVPVTQTGVAAGMNANIRTIGGGIGAAITASIVTASVTGGRLPKESGYTSGFTVLAAVMLLAVAVAARIPSLQRTRDAEQQEQADLAHGELAIVAGGTVVGDLPE
jgi:MFS family permease